MGGPVTAKIQFDGDIKVQEELVHFINCLSQIAELYNDEYEDNEYYDNEYDDEDDGNNISSKVLEIINMLKAKTSIQIDDEEIIEYSKMLINGEITIDDNSFFIYFDSHFGVEYENMCDFTEVFKNFNNIFFHIGIYTEVDQLVTEIFLSNKKELVNEYDVGDNEDFDDIMDHALYIIEINDLWVENKLVVQQVLDYGFENIEYFKKHISS